MYEVIIIATNFLSSYYIVTKNVAYYFENTSMAPLEFAAGDNSPLKSSTYHLVVVHHQL